MKLIVVLTISVLGLTQGIWAKNQNRNRISSCPSGWYRILDSCIWLSRETKNFDSANRECGRLTRNGRLFEPKSRLQNELVLTLVKHRQQKHKAWVGITDREFEGKFKYVSSGKDVFFTNWATGEPNDHQDGQDCVNFYSIYSNFKLENGKLELESQSRWDDESCNAKFHFICEKPLNE